MQGEGLQVGREGSCRAGMRGRLRGAPAQQLWGLEGPSCPSAHL